MGSERYFFQKLTPVSDVDLSVYEEAIDFVFDNQDVKNVAISGAYCAGKSSILETYKKKHLDYHFKHISLAHFFTKEQDASEPIERPLESVLEGKILNQLMHQIPAEKIQQSNFRIKQDVSFKALFKPTILASLLIASAVILLLFSRVSAYFEAQPDNWVNSIFLCLFSPYSAFFSTIVFVFCATTLLYSLIKAQKNKNIFRKISLQGNEIEIFEDQDDSYFDKYLNEVLYLFESTKAKVIVFEDMDRFGSYRIFERLREINTLINLRRKKKDGADFEPLRFFYLLRDDIFTSKDRTKFFDFIIPIVPIVDSSNSHEQFLKHLKNGDMLENLDNGFLQGLSLYVDDMRILKNICNEFVVYINRLNTTDLDLNKMFAIICYKNLFPRDFSDLQLARGFLFSIFAQKAKLADQILVQLKTRRQDLINSIEQCKSETLITIEELDDAYAAKENRFKKEPYNPNQLTAESQEKKKSNDVELAKRKQSINHILDSKLPIMEKELAQIEHEIAMTQTKSMKDLLTRENIDVVFTIEPTDEIRKKSEFKQIRESDYFALLKFLIRNGHIDETYADYITYFYDDIMNANDKSFLRRITDKRGAEFAYSLKNPKSVIESPVLRDVDFEQVESLNFDLLEFLLYNNNNSKNAVYLNTLLSQLMNTENFDFIFKFYETGKSTEQFVKKLNEQWPEFISHALKHTSVASSQMKKYTIDTLCTSDEESIKKININNCLGDYISQSPDYLDIEQPIIDKIISNFLQIEISFVSINYADSNRELFDEVYQHNLFALSFENISLMLESQYGINNDSDIIHKNFTQIMSKPDSPLAKYVLTNMSAYADTILISCEGNITDDDNMAIELINNAEVADATKKRYIELLSTEISDITLITDTTLWSEMLHQELIPFSGSNTLNYFQKHGMDATLIEFINTSPAGVDFSLIANEFGEEIATKFFVAVAICNDITTDKYIKILADVGYVFDSFEVIDIADDKFEGLISKGILPMTPESLGFVRDNYEKHVYTFIRRFLDEYLALQKPELFKLSEALQILTWDIDDVKKTQMLSISTDKISIVGKQFSDIVNTYIINHNLEPEDKTDFFAKYNEYEAQTQGEITRLALESVGDIIANKMRLEDSLLSILFKADAITHMQKIILLTIAIPVLDEESCTAHFDELGLSELKNIFLKGGGRRNYAKSEEITVMLDALKLNGWIYDYHDDERNNNRYCVIKNKPRNLS